MNNTEMTEHELLMLDYYVSLPEDQQPFMRDMMAVILDNIQADRKPLVRKVLLAMCANVEKRNLPV